MEQGGSYRDGAQPEPTLAWERGFGWALFDVFGAVVMIPFGMFMLAGATVPVVTGQGFVADVVRYWSAGRHGAAAGTAVVVVLVEIFALWLGWVLLRSGAGMGLDLLGARRTVEGTVTERRTVSTGKGGVTYCATVAGESLRPSGSAYKLLVEGERVRVQFGRFERAVYKLWR